MLIDNAILRITNCNYSFEQQGNFTSELRYDMHEEWLQVIRAFTDTMAVTLQHKYST